MVIEANLTDNELITCGVVRSKMMTRVIRKLAIERSTIMSSGASIIHS